MTTLPRLTRYTLGIKTDNLFTDCLEAALLAGYVSRAEKLGAVQKISVKLDSLKFFLRLLWELKSIDNNKYTLLAVPLVDAGKMVGGWLASCKKETLPT
ncbi:MAG: hypothetical protein A3I29_03670 [Candidatus Magasanikbacteria bacterium RIFCSPLOWO2_02_FULL_44_11]|uniref:Four helix bundle protein n=1 Tax=Candidatus Magasanikbacteria bacterium RIFCSPLOWO2_02_FULL_44_11 TaxID=1798689 RepID=A0A1F6NAM2_9BACT|nr:MAG: hypothetical protein A3I29_03670 [Candidatus Magasanikbacteria bacterium RIFCSPLOWO2_02_FULL_44_11]